MSRPIDQELSATAAQRMLRSIALWDWPKADQMTGVARVRSIFVDVPAPQAVVDHVQEDEKRDPSSDSHWWKHAGGYWYLNEVPEEFIDVSEKSENQLGAADPPIDLSEAPGVSCDVGGAHS
jgi:hypothetical protein